MEITKYRPINKGCVIGNFGLKISKWGIFINDCTLFDKGGKRWISLPQRQYEDKGEKKYAPYISFMEKSHMIAFTEKVLAILDEHIAKSASSMPEEKCEGQGELPF